AVKTEVARVLTNLVDEADFGEIYINGVLFTNEDAELSTNPDMLAASWEGMEENRVRYVPGKKAREVEIAGSPDWLLELVSERSVPKDLKHLQHAYHQAGVREYWVIDARGEAIAFHIFHWRKNGFAVAPNKDGWLHSRVFGADFRLARETNRRGAWKY